MVTTEKFLKGYYTEKLHGQPPKGVKKTYTQKLFPDKELNWESNLHFYGRLDDGLMWGGCMKQRPRN